MILDSVRPRCRECGKVCHPAKAQVFLRKSADKPEEEVLLVGIYCEGDCLLNAWARGWPEWYLKQSK